MRSATFGARKTGPARAGAGEAMPAHARRRLPLMQPRGEP